MIIDLEVYEGRLGDYVRYVECSVHVTTMPSLGLGPPSH
jgi:hypothetical protein